MNRPGETGGRFRLLRERARRINRARDRVDRARGHATPNERPPEECLRIVLEAMEAGMTGADWDCIAEGYDMLERFVLTMPRSTS